MVVIYYIIEIYYYIFTNRNIWEAINKSNSELHYFYPVYAILDIIFRDSEIDLFIEE